MKGKDDAPVDSEEYRWNIVSPVINCIQLSKNTTTFSAKSVFPDFWRPNYNIFN